MRLWSKRICHVIISFFLISSIGRFPSMAKDYYYNYGTTYRLNSVENELNKAGFKTTMSCGDTLTIDGSNMSIWMLWGSNASFKYKNNAITSRDDTCYSSKYVTTTGNFEILNKTKLTHNMSGKVIFYCSAKSWKKGILQYNFTINHVWSGWTQTKAATCTSAGSKKRTCSGCGATETATINALGHSWSGWQTNASQHWKKCTRSGCTAITSKANHNFGEYYNDTAKCTTAGTRQRKCGTCGYVETSKSTALGHAWPSSYSQSGGYLYKNCTRSGCGTRLETKGISYTVTYDGNGATSGTMTNQGFTYGTAQNLKQNTFARQDYDFLGWSINASDASPTYTDQQSVSNLTTTNNATITLYAIWKLSTTTITFHDKGGSGGPGSVTWLIGSTQRPTPPIREGYNFAGLNTAEDGTGSDWPKDNVVPAGQSDYYAQWSPNMYTVIEEENK